MNDNEDHDLEQSEKIEIMINKIGTVMRIFRRSSIKNDVLQKNCQASSRVQRGRDGVGVRASALQLVDLGSNLLVELYQKT